MTFRKLVSLVKKRLGTIADQEVFLDHDVIKEVVTILCTMQAEEMVNRVPPEKGLTGFLDSEVSRIAAKMLKEKSRGFYVAPENGDESAEV